MTQNIDSSQVAAYLQDNPDFFNEYPNILASLRLTSQVAGKTLSLNDRQIEIVRQKNKSLEKGLADLIQIAKSNDILFQNILDWTRELLAEKDEIARIQVLVDALSRLFNIEYVSIRLWSLKEAYQQEWFAKDVSESLQIFTNSLEKPYCGKNNNLEAARVFEGANIASIGLIPIKAKDKICALLILGSSEDNRFHPNMATDYITDMAKTISVVISPLIDE